VRPKRRGARGYILAEALVSAAIASLAGLLSVTLLIWSAEAVDRAQSTVGATQVLSRLYEEARTLTPDDLARPASGAMGRYSWVRSPGASLDRDNDYSPAPVHFVVQWMAGGQPQRMLLETVIRPSARPGTPKPGTP
jgi:type II secretory pathway pseudopilin PulG